MIDIMSKIMPEIPLSFFSAMVLSERAPSMTYPTYSVGNMIRSALFIEQFIGQFVEQYEGTRQ